MAVYDGYAMAGRKTTRKSPKRQSPRVAAHQVKGVPITAALVEQRVADVDPRPVKVNFVVVKGRRYPPKQVIELAFPGTPVSVRADEAARVLHRLGFPTGRAKAHGPKPWIPVRTLGHASSQATPVSSDDAFDAQLRAHVGEWVATRGTKLLVAAADAKSVVAWLGEHNEKADTMYKVPRDLSEVSGTAA